MKEVNVRYGVVNEAERIAYETKWQVQKGYDFISYDSGKAIGFCRKKGNGWIVEKISNKPDNEVNFKTVIFRGGK